MARTPLAPALNWIENLYEVGSSITRLVQEEADVLAEIEALKRQIEARKRDLAEIRATADRSVRELWREDEIAEAKARTAEEAA